MAKVGPHLLQLVIRLWGIIGPNLLQPFRRLIIGSGKRTEFRGQGRVRAEMGLGLTLPKNFG